MSQPAPRLTARDQLLEAWFSISTQGSRTVGTILAMALGVAAVTTTINVAHAAQQQVSDRFDEVRATEVLIGDARDSDTVGVDDPLFPDDAEDRLSGLAGVVAGGVLGEHGEHELHSKLLTDAAGSGRREATVMSASPGGLEALRPAIAGRALAPHDQEGAQRVAMVGRRLAEQLDSDFRAGQSLFIDGLGFTVVGVIEDVDREHDVLGSVLIPERTAGDLFRQAQGDRQAVIDVSPGAAATVGRQAPAALAPHDPDRFSVALPPDPASLRMSVEDDLTQLVLAVAVIVVVVGGIGIANSTMVAVLERTPEFGLKRAIGARPSHLYRLVLTETVLLGAIGGVAGTLLGLLATMTIVITSGWTPIVAPLYLLLGPLVGVGIGAIAGLWPAWRAAKIEPTAALQH